MCGQSAHGVVLGPHADPTFLKEDDYQFFRGVGVKMAYGIKKIAKKNPAGQLQRVGRLHRLLRVARPTPNSAVTALLRPVRTAAST
jgi:hypothetical protein